MNRENQPILAAQLDDTWISLGWLPVTLFLEFGATFIACYAIAVFEGHVYPLFPYISDTGACPPESCIFGQLLNIGAFFMGWTGIVRYQQVALHINVQRTPEGDTPSATRCRTINKWALAFGFVSSLGVSMVGNFQESNVGIVHEIGALLAFLAGTVYSWLQMYLTYRTHRNAKWMAHFRLGISVSMTLILLLFVVFHTGQFGKDYQLDCSGMRNTTHATNVTLFTPERPNNARLMAAISEWLLATIVLVLFASFYGEFRTVRMSWPKFAFREMNIIQNAAPRD